jgi:hypothetical protein
LARQALRVGPDDPDVLARAAVTFGYFGEYPSPSKTGS